MNKKILLVDDEPALLRALDRHLGEMYDLELAEGPIKGLEAVCRESFAVIVSDMRMPGMDGVQFLCKVREIAPNTVRMMLTGNSDLTTAVSAVNEGSVFRFVNKPADPEVLKLAINACLEQHRLIESEKELLEKTLGGSVRVLVEILATVNPDLFGKSQILKTRVASVASALGVSQVWEVEIAAMLCQVGAVAIPPGLSHKDRTSARLPEFEAGLMKRLPFIGASLIAKIPRLEGVAQSVLYQDQNFDGTGTPGDGLHGKDIPITSRILKIVKDFGALTESGKSGEDAFRLMRSRTGWYDSQILDVASQLLIVRNEGTDERPIQISALKPGDILTSNLTSNDGILLMRAGQVLTAPSCARISSYIGMGLIKNDQSVYVVDRPARAA